MKLINSSLTIVLIGDWNKLYIQPNWIAENVFCQKKIEIGVMGKGIDLSINYRCNNVLIAPSQTKMIFTALNMVDDTVERFVSCANNFLKKAKTPVLSAYGFNCEYEELDSSVFADVLDSIADNSKIIESGFQISGTKISRTLLKNDKVIILESRQNENKTIMHFNEHHGIAVEEMPVLDVDRFYDFISVTKDLVSSLGYDIEENEL